MRRRDVRPSSDWKTANEKARGGFLRAGFEDCCDDGVMPVICPTRQAPISLFQKYLAGQRDTCTRMGRKQLQKLAFVIERPRFRKAEDWGGTGNEVRTTAADDAQAGAWGECGVVTCGRRPIHKSPMKKPAADFSARALKIIAMMALCQ